MTAEQPFCEVESVKAVSDVYAPVTGEVIAVNQTLPDHLEIFSSDPYGEGLDREDQHHRRLEPVASCWTHAAYQKQCAEEGH